MRLGLKKTINGGVFVIAMVLPLLGYTNESSKDNVRNARYCEIITEKSRLTFSVYTTYDLNNCPDEVWKKITVDKIKKDTGSFFVYLNGPRYFIMDTIKNAKLISSEKRVFEGLEVHEAGIVKLGIMDIIRGSKPYIEHKVKRNNTWVYDKNKPVYELINANGRVYVMQSYSIEVAPLKISDLATLGKRLKLPKGWKFRTGVLNKTCEIVTTDIATVIQDDLLNTYQLAAKDCLG